MKELVCIVCPTGCTLAVSGEGDDIQVTGFKCPRGKRFAINEQTNPTRTISSTVKTAFKQVPVLPVRVSAEIPKGQIFNVMAQINRVVVTQPLGCGDTVIENVLGLGVDVIATSDILKELA